MFDKHTLACGHRECVTGAMTDRITCN
jgi:hypothetical protein